MPQLLSWEKTSTWRLFDDKNLSIWDELEFRKSEDNDIIGYGTITSLIEKPVRDINENDYSGHEKFRDTEEIIQNLRKYYRDTVDENSIVKIIHFTFKKL
jgi:hypothetical protein